MKYLIAFAAFIFVPMIAASAQAQPDSDVMMMPALYGPYTGMREASGTAWEPDSTPMNAWQMDYDDWAFMAHGFANGIYDNQGGKRGAEKGFSNSMGMFMGSHPLGDGIFGFRTMLSLDPLMGKRGYPELLQTGETADGKDELVDRQHPHDLFMELATTYSLNVSKDASVFIYGGLPGEPALGPAAFMHRESGMEIPEAPITHHWLDSTHITEGVITLGTVIQDLKLEGSIFNGREPDQYRYDIEVRPLTSHSFRATYNFLPNWSTQTSYGFLQGPEQLHPDADTKRITSSITYNLPFKDNNWATTFAWGRDVNEPGNNLDGFLLESTLKFGDTHTLFGKFEDVEKDELFADVVPDNGEVYRVSKLALGYIYDFPPMFTHLKLGVGTEESLAILPESLKDSYGETPFSFLLLVRAVIQ